MAVVLGALAMGLAGLAMYEQEDASKVIESPYEDAMDGGSAVLGNSTSVDIVRDPRSGHSIAADRIARHEFLVEQNGGDDAYYTGMLDRNVRTNLNQLRTTDGKSLPSLKAMQRAGVWAQQLAQDRRYQRSLGPYSETGDQGTNSGRVRPVFLTYLSQPAALDGTPYSREVQLDSMNNVKDDTTGPIDTNRTLWFRDPYNIGNPFMPFNRTRGAPTSVLPGSDQLSAQTEKEVEQLLPRAGTAIIHRGGGRTRRGAKQVRFIHA